MSRLKAGIIKGSITVAAMVLAGCASKLKIYEGLVTTTPVTQNRDHGSQQFHIPIDPNLDS